MTNFLPIPDDDLDKLNCVLAGWENPVARLRQALDGDELVLYAQPVRLLNGPPEYPLAELLVRLREEERALLPPGEFLPAFEYFGLMLELDRWVVRQAIARLSRGSQVPQLSVNVSARTISDVEFAPYVAAELVRGRLAAGSLVFEVNESDALSMPQAAARFAAALKFVGCKLLMDGFGQRSVSFAQLKSLDMNYVKVDGVIVRKLESSQTARSKLAAIVRFGQIFGLGVIGECVETPAALDRLREAGAAYAQGFGVHLPAPLDAVAERPA